MSVPLRHVTTHKQLARSKLRKVRVSTTAAREGKSPRANEAALSRGIGCTTIHYLLSINIDTNKCDCFEYVLKLIVKYLLSNVLAQYPKRYRESSHCRPP